MTPSHHTICLQGAAFSQQDMFPDLVQMNIWKDLKGRRIEIYKTCSDFFGIPLLNIPHGGYL